MIIAHFGQEGRAVYIIYPVNLSVFISRLQDILREKNKINEKAVFSFL